MACETPLRHWRNRSVLGIGEAMLEFATLGGDLYRRGFAGDTLNTCWHMAQILGPHAQVAYFTRVGVDTFSEQLVRFIGSSRMDARTITRDPQRSLGLYAISLNGVERQFSYWRDSSAARCLADDPVALADATQGRGLIHVSGITLAVIGTRGRSNLIEQRDPVHAGELHCYRVHAASGKPVGKTVESGSERGVGSCSSS
jgi:2-dehydro-3-deoxygluconokinase